MVNGKVSGPDSVGDQGFLWVLPDLVLRTSHLFFLLYFPFLLFTTYFSPFQVSCLAMGTSLSGTTGTGLIVGSTPVPPINLSDIRFPVLRSGILIVLIRFL